MSKTKQCLHWGGVLCWRRTGGSHSCVNENVLLEMWFCGGQGNVMIAHPQGRREHVTSRGVDICVVKGAAACEEIRQLELVDLEGGECHELFELH